MLVFSRKKNESIVINNDITIVVVEIRGDKVRLGIEAPDEIPVHRREIFDAIHTDDYLGFQSALRERKFEDAYDIFYNARGKFGTHEEINQMVYGYQGKRNY